jgi:16S rRNA (adenine1518-N6/adenine1519-N6)-dimethyltransferase
MIQIDDLPPLREVIRRHDLAARKSLGQNFLLDLNLTARIARAAGPLDGITVLEVGPGPGGLTRALLATDAARVVAIERDPRCRAALAEIAARYPDRLTIVEGDAMQIDPTPHLGAGPVRIVANLPYNIATALLIGWLTVDPWPPWYQSMTLMFQREVAERIVAKPGSEHYGRLSIAAQWRSIPRIAMAVHRSSFVPPPKVASAVVHIVPGKEPPGIDATILERLTAAAFGQRRKMLRSSLKAMPGALDALAKLGIDSERRAETVSVAEYVALARSLS